MNFKKILVFIILFLVPISVNASDAEYDITNYYIDANILENGSMEVNELIVLDGTFNGYEREISFANSALYSYKADSIDFEHDAIYNAKSISDYYCKAKYVDNVSFATFNENFKELNMTTNYASASNNDVYLSESSTSKTFRMYYRADNQKVAFLIHYIVDDAVVMHNDVAELYWTFIGNEYSDAIEDLNIRVHLPSQDDSNFFRIWAHGELTGEIHKYDNKYILATADKIYANSPVDIRTTFDKSLITDSSSLRSSNEDALDKIVAVETQRADEANAKREAAKKLMNVARCVSGVMILWQIISIFYIYRKYDKEYISDFQNDYNREFINDYNVEIVDYIMNKSLTPNAMSASIMNLIYKKNIECNKIEDGGKKDNYEFKLLNQDNLSDAEINLIGFLFNTVGKDNTFTTKQLKDYAKSTKTYNNFTSSYTNWKNKVTNEGKKLHIYESHGKIVGYALLMVFLAFAIQFIFSSLTAYTILLYFNFLLSIGILVYSLAFKKRTKYGNDQYVRWKAFKKFLLDFGDFSVKELPEIALWERYMVYATVFGIADKVSKVMNVKIKELEASETYVGTYNSYYFHSNLAASINSSVNTAVSNAHSTAASVASSSSSSGFGGGGGFSSGGGFGGGGGGGHGF